MGTKYNGEGEKKNHAGARQGLRQERGSLNSVVRIGEETK